MRLGSSLLALAALLALPVPAAHASRPALGCLRAGSPGELTLLEQQSSGEPIAHVFGGDATTVRDLTSTGVGEIGRCADSASAGGITAVAVVSSDKSDSEHVSVAMRRGDGALGRPVDVSVIGPDDGFVSNQRVAVGPRGDVAVAWVQLAGSVFSPGNLRVSVMIARRPPGGDFGAPETVVEVPLGAAVFGIPAFDVGIDGGGTTTVLWSHPLPEGDNSGVDPTALDAASAPAGNAFGAAQRVVDQEESVSDVALAVGADGHALAVWTSAAGVAASERPAAAGAFAAPHTLANTAGRPAFADEPSAALGPDGSALASWRITGRRQLAIDAAWHTAGRGFGARRRVWSGTAPTTGIAGRASLAGATGGGGGGGGVAGGGTFTVGYVNGSGQLPVDDVPPRALIGADGKLTLTWLEVRPLDGDQVPTAWSATGTLADGFKAAQRVSGDCRAAEGITPFTGDSGPLVGWTDNSTEFEFPDYEQATGDGRIHIQTADHVLPSAAPPIDLSAKADPKTQRIYFNDPIKIAASCDQACDLRAWIPGRPGGAPVAATTAALERSGRVRIGLTAADDNGYAVKKPITIHVRACDPSGIAVAESKVRVQVAAKPVHELVHLSAIHARRSGGDVIVTWHTDGTSARQVFYVEATKGRKSDTQPVIKAVRGSRRRTFKARVTAKDARFVTIIAWRADPPRRERAYEVRISRP